MNTRVDKLNIMNYIINDSKIKTKKGEDYYEKEE